MQKYLPLFFALIMSLGVACNNGNTGNNGSETRDTTTSEPKAPAVLNYGVQDGYTYSNDYFGLTVEVPEGWFVRNRQENAMMEQAGNAAPVPIEALQVIYLVDAFVHEPGSIVEYNPGVNIVATNLTEDDGSATNEAYLLKLRENLGKFTNYSFPDETITTQKVGGVEMGKAFGQTLIEGINILQEYYVTMRKGYVIQMTVSYADDAQKAELMKLVNGVKFD